MARFSLMGAKEGEGKRMKKFISLVRFSSVRSHSKLLINVGDVKTLFSTCLTFSFGFFFCLPFGERGRGMKIYCNFAMSQNGFLTLLTGQEKFLCRVFSRT